MVCTHKIVAGVVKFVENIGKSLRSGIDRDFRHVKVFKIERRKRRGSIKRIRGHKSYQNSSRNLLGKQRRLKLIAPCRDECASKNKCLPNFTRKIALTLVRYAENHSERETSQVVSPRPLQAHPSAQSFARRACSYQALYENRQRFHPSLEA